MYTYIFTYIYIYTYTYTYTYTYIYDEITYITGAISQVNERRFRLRLTRGRQSVLPTSTSSSPFHENFSRGPIRVSSCHAYIWIRHVTHTNESCHTSEWDKPRIPYLPASTKISGGGLAWVTAHVSMYHVTRINESRHTYECVMSTVLMSHVTLMNVSCHPY